MHTLKSIQPDKDAPPLPKNKGLASVFNCGCGMLFLGTGLLPLLAWLNILSRAGTSGGEQSVFVTIAGLPFVAVGLYFIGNAVTLLVRGHRLSDRLLFNLGIFFLAIPLHYWLFFGKPDGGSVTGVSLPGGFTFSFFDAGNISFVVGKIAMAFLLIWTLAKIETNWNH